MRLSTIAIALLSVSLIVSILAGFFTEIGSNYGVSAGDVNFSSYDKMQELSGKVNETKEKIDSINVEDATIFDVIGKFFAGGVSAVKTMIGAVDTANDLTNQALTDVPVGNSGDYLKIFLLSVLTLIVFGTILAIIIGDRVNKI